MKKEIMKSTYQGEQIDKKANRKYKDGIFRMLFNNEDEARKLYNALSGENYGKETEIKIQTLDNTLFMDYKNDVSFTVNDKFIVFAEHQSTISPNMPARMLSYVARTYEKMFGDSMYKQSPVTLPVPELYIFYNGSRMAEDEKMYRLSDNYAAEAPKNSIEAVAKVINISYNEDKELLNKCRTMKEYSQFVYFVNEALKDTGNLESAMCEAIKHAGREGILKEFLDKHGAEVLSMEYLFELSREKYDEMVFGEMRKEVEEAKKKAEEAEKKAEEVAKKAEEAEKKAKEVIKKAEKATKEAEKATKEAEKATKEAEKARKEVKKEAKEEANLETAVRMKEAGCDDAFISKMTGLPTETVETL